MDSDTNANANAVVNTDVTDEQQNPDPIWMQKIQGIFGEFRASLIDFRRNIKRIFEEEEERKTRALLVLGVITNLNAIVTNLLNLLGYKNAATIFGIVIGALTIITFIVQSGLFSPLEPA